MSEKNIEWLKRSLLSLAGKDVEFQLFHCRARGPIHSVSIIERYNFSIVAVESRWVASYHDGQWERGTIIRTEVAFYNPIIELVDGKMVTIRNRRFPEVDLIHIPLEEANIIPVSIRL